MADQKETPYIVVERQSTGVGTFLWGAILGAGLALIFAPRSGREMRREIGGGIRKFKDSAEETVQRVQHSVTGTLDDLRGQMTEKMDSARRAMDAGREAALRSRADLERRVHNERVATERAHSPFTEIEVEDEVIATDEEKEHQEI
jgi:gas vesicle protein